MTDRRGLLRGAMGLIALPRAARAQPPARLPQIGVFSSGTREETRPLFGAMEEELGRLGHVEGRNVRFQYRFADGRFERLPELAAELVRLPVDVLVAISNQSVEIARRATARIPIVMTLVSDPVGSGFVASLARPGGNVTGLTSDVTPDIAGKRLALLKEAVPGLSRVAVLWEPVPTTPEYRKAAEGAAARLGLTLRPIEVRSHDELPRALEAIRQERPDGLLVFLSRITFARAPDIAAFASEHRLPAIHGARLFAERGGLLAYGPDHRDLFRRAAGYVDRILRGARPADLPVEQPSTFELVVNRRTARAWGLALPAAFLSQADQVLD